MRQASDAKQALLRRQPE
ncbi:hypothetical protein A2U01_0087770, partial [Trifolium medium]|nr:hypothetical protein [Trifolium medium]